MGIGDVSRYDIYQDNTKIGTSTTTSFTVNGLDPSKSYTFSVDAVDSTGISGKSTVGALWDRIGIVLDAFTPAECANYFKAAGYEPD